MTTNPPASNTIALTEKKMDMSLDDIISMSKKKNTTKEGRPHRMPIKNQSFKNFGPSQNQKQKSFKARQFANSRSAMRQGVLAERRTNFNGKNNFPITNKIAKKAANNFPILHTKPIWTRPRVGPTYAQGSVYVQNGAASKNIPFGHAKKPQTMDALFSQMQQQRRRTNPKPTSSANTSRQVAQRRPPAQHFQRNGRGLAVAYNAY